MTELLPPITLRAGDRERLLALQRAITPPDTMQSVAAAVERVYRRLTDARADRQGQA